MFPYDSWLWPWPLDAIPLTPRPAPASPSTPPPPSRPIHVPCVLYAARCAAAVSLRSKGGRASAPRLSLTRPPAPRVSRFSRNNSPRQCAGARSLLGILCFFARPWHGSASGIFPLPHAANSSHALCLLPFLAFALAGAGRRVGNIRPSGPHRPRLVPEAECPHCLVSASRPTSGLTCSPSSMPGLSL
jgi:hypothetical protein